MTTLHVDDAASGTRSPASRRSTRCQAPTRTSPRARDPGERAPAGGCRRRGGRPGAGRRRRDRCSTGVDVRRPELPRLAWTRRPGVRAAERRRARRRPRDGRGTQRAPSPWSRRSRSAARTGVEVTLQGEIDVVRRRGRRGPKWARPPRFSPTHRSSNSPTSMCGSRSARPVGGAAPTVSESTTDPSAPEIALSETVSP